MPNNRFKIAILAAVIFGLMAAYGIHSFLRQQREAANALKLPTQDVVIAAKEIMPGTTISKEMVKVASWPKTSVPAESFATPRQVVGKVMMAKTLANEPITKSKLTREGTDLTVRLTPGLRAMAVKVDEIVGVSGFIAPEDRVDVITTMAPPGKNSRNQRIAKIVLQNKRVLSVAQKIERNGDKPKIVRSITLEVTPAEGEKLSLATLQGKIILALRAVGDNNMVRTRGSTKRDLLSLAPRAKRRAVKAPRKKYQVEVYMGNQKSVIVF